MRSYEEFKSKVLWRLDRDIPDPKTVRVMPAHKMNLTPQDAVLVTANRNNTSPAVYLGQCFQDYEACGNFDKVYADILEAYRQNIPAASTDTSFFASFERVKPYITVRLVNYEKNAELLENVPHKKFLDLAIVFYIVPFRIEDRIASVLVRDYMMETWGKEIDDIFPAAVENTKRIFPEKVMEMKRSFPILPENDGMDCAALEGLPPMYVVTSGENVFGAISMFFKDEITEVADRHQSDLFVLPSSIHELILLPAPTGTTLEEMGAMVRDVNAAAVKPAEFLSDHAYYYSRETGEITY